MTTRRSVREAKQLRFRRVRAVLAGGLVLGVGAAMTFASWTDREFTSATITAGSFAVQSRTNLGSFEAFSNTNSRFPFWEALYPGQKRAAWIQIKNNGTVPAVVSLDGVAVTGASGNGAPTGNSLALQNALVVSAAAFGTTDVNSAPPCTTSTPTSATATGLNVVPSPTATTPIPVGQVATFCVIVELPLAAGTNTQSGDVRPTWTFTATTPTT